MRRWAKRVMAGALVVLAFGAAGLVCQRVGERGRYATSYSTYGAGPDGTRGVYLLARELGARPERWAEDLGRLPERGMLVALGSCDQLMRRELGRVERENLTRWVAEGGVLVVAGVPSYLTRDAFGVALSGDRERCRPTEGLIGMLARAEDRASGRKRTQDDSGRDLDDLPDAFREDPSATYDEVTAQDPLPAAQTAVASGAPLEGMAPIGLRRALDVEVSQNVLGDTMLRLDGPDGRAAGVRVRVGQGFVIALASASPFANRDLRDGGGVLFARLVRAYAPDGPVLFDEYHLGVGQQRGTIRYLRQVGAGAIFVQVLLLIGLALWRAGARFGGVRIDPLPEPGGTASYVDGVATLYEKASDPAGAARIVVRRALARIAAHHHVVTSDPARLMRELEERGRHDAAAAVRDLDSILVSEIGRPPLARLVSEIDARVRRATDERAPT